MISAISIRMPGHCQTAGLITSCTSHLLSGYTQPYGIIIRGRWTARCSVSVKKCTLRKVLLCVNIYIRMSANAAFFQPIKSHIQYVQYAAVCQISVAHLGDSRYLISLKGVLIHFTHLERMMAAIFIPRLF